MKGLLLPLAGLLLAAGSFGLWLGLRAVPPTETEIINAQAARYVTETGGDLVDCYAVPSGVADVRLLVICERDEAEPWYAAVDEFGRVVEGALSEDGA